MDEFMKMIIEAAIEQQKQMTKTGSTGSRPTMNGSKFAAELKKNAAKDIAEANRLLYEAHIEAGFTSEEALTLTAATLK